MSEWINFDRWEDCTRMQRPGYVFEVVNRDGQQLLTQCDPGLTTPFDWRSAPVKFRIVKAPPPRHSRPIPPESKRRD